MSIIHLSSSLLLIQNIIIKAILLYVTYVTIISLESQSYSSLSLFHSLRLSSSSSSAAAAAATTVSASSSSSSSSVNLFYQTKDWTIKFFDHIKNDNHVIYKEQNMNEQLEKRAINDLVSTNYWIDSTIYHQSNNTAIDWDASYADTTSLNYATLSTRYCDLIMRTLQKASLTANKQKSCTKVVFTPRQILIIWEKRQATTNTSSNVVGGNATIQMNTTSADVVNTTDFSNAFITTYNTSTQSNDTIQLFDLQAGRK
ncbi:unnamed protein product [Schistosoma guineensis]|nr:unnamed protein product [Schistosoma guineensis]